MKINKGDFIELDFTAFVKGGTIFDTTKEEEAKKAGLVDERKKHEFKPMRICVGERMVIKGLDDILVGKEIGKNYNVEIQPKDAFGKRNPKLIKTVPLSAFQQMPQPGMFVNVNGLVARVVTVTGGRALIDLNNPLAGKVVVYKFKINKLIEDNSEKIKLLGNNYGIIIEDIKMKDNEKKVEIKIKSKKEVEKALEQFKEKIKTLLGFECKFE